MIPFIIWGINFYYAEMELLLRSNKKIALASGESSQAVKQSIALSLLNNGNEINEVPKFQTILFLYIVIESNTRILNGLFFSASTFYIF